MRKIFYIVAAVAALSLTACDKDKKSGNGFSPNSCYATGGTSQYQYINSRCVDRRSGQAVPVGQEYLCGQNQVGASYDPRCNQYTGWNSGLPNNGIPFGNNPNDLCSRYYGYGWYTEILYTGQPICVNLAAQQWGQFNSSWNAGAGFYFRF